MRNINRRLRRLEEVLTPPEEEIKIWRIVIVPSGEIAGEFHWSKSGKHNKATGRWFESPPRPSAPK
jgi:hypothetical protein